MKLINISRLGEIEYKLNHAKDASDFDRLAQLYTGPSTGIECYDKEDSSIGVKVADNATVDANGDIHPYIA